MTFKGLTLATSFNALKTQLMFTMENNTEEFFREKEVLLTIEFLKKYFYFNITTLYVKYLRRITHTFKNSHL